MITKTLKKNTMRKAIAFALSTMFMATAGITATSAAEIGNSANPVSVSDRDYTVADATRIQKYLVGTATISDDEFDFYDFNKDGRISISDVTDIQKYLVGLIKKPTAPNTESQAVTNPAKSIKVNNKNLISKSSESTQPTKPTVQQESAAVKVEESSVNVTANNSTSQSVAQATEPSTTVSPTTATAETTSENVNEETENDVSEDTNTDKPDSEGASKEYVFTDNDVMHIRKTLAGIETLTDEEKSIYDVNNDGVVNVSDVTIIQKLVAEQQPTEEPLSVKDITHLKKALAGLEPFKDSDYVRLDMNGDGIINILDVTLLQKKLVS